MRIESDSLGGEEIESLWSIVGPGMYVTADGCISGPLKISILGVSSTA